MISLSDNQLRIVAEAADRLPAEARGTFLRRVVAEVREGRSFKDSDIERAVRVALLGQSMKQASVSSTDQGGGKRGAPAGPRQGGARRFAAPMLIDLHPNFAPAALLGSTCRGNIGIANAARRTSRPLSHPGGGRCLKSVM
jgi:hypothetical protein